MSSAEHTSTPAPAPAGKPKRKRSGGPRTPEGKARSSLNALKTGAYAKSDRALREIMLRRGESPADLETLHQEMIDTWSPDDVMEAMLVQSVTEKTFDRANLRAAWMESQLAALRLGGVQAERRQLRARRLRPGCYAADPLRPPLWQASDSPAKFSAIFDILDHLQGWFEIRECPDAFPEAMEHLYGGEHSRAGERIRTLFIQLFDENPAAVEEAVAELPKWIAQERRDVEQERDLYQQEQEIRATALSLNEEDVARKQAALEKQIREETRLLLQIKSKRLQWASGRDAEETGDDAPAPTANPVMSAQGTSESAAAPNEVAPEAAA